MPICAATTYTIGSFYPQWDAGAAFPKYCWLDYSGRAIRKNHFGILPKGGSKRVDDLSKRRQLEESKASRAELFQISKGSTPYVKLSKVVSDFSFE